MGQISNECDEGIGADGPLDGELSNNNRAFKKMNSMRSNGSSSDRKKQIKTDMMVTMTTILLQDLPFFSLRMALIFGYLNSLHRITYNNELQDNFQISKTHYGIITLLNFYLVKVWGNQSHEYLFHGKEHYDYPTSNVSPLCSRT